MNEISFFPGLTIRWRMKPHPALGSTRSMALHARQYASQFKAPVTFANALGWEPQGSFMRPHPALSGTCSMALQATRQRHHQHLIDRMRKRDHRPHAPTPIQARASPPPCKLYASCMQAACKPFASRPYVQSDSCSAIISTWSKPALSQEL